MNGLARAGERAHVDHGLRADGHAAHPRRHGQHARHDPPRRHRARARRWGGEGRPARAADRADHREGEVQRRPGRLARVLDRHHPQHRRRSVHRHCPSGPDVRGHVPIGGTGARRALAHGRGFGHDPVVADSRAQLRHSHGRAAGRGGPAPCPFRHLGHREPAADDSDGVCGDSHDAHPGDIGTVRRGDGAEYAGT
jgi:hypothetical protein